MTNTFEQKKIEELKKLKQIHCVDLYDMDRHCTDMNCDDGSFSDKLDIFILGAIRQARIEGVREGKVKFIDSIMEMLEYRYANFYSTEDTRKIIKSTFDLLRHIKNGYLHSDTKEKDKNI